MQQRPSASCFVLSSFRAFVAPFGSFRRLGRAMFSWSGLSSAGFRDSHVKSSKTASWDSAVAIEQLAPAPEGDLGKLYLPFDHDSRAGDQRADGFNVRTVLVTQWQDEQQVLHLRDAELREALSLA